MRITSFDELQREITKLKSDLTALTFAKGAPYSSDIRNSLLFIDSLDELSRKTGQLWMSAIGELGFNGMATAERYSKRIRQLENSIANTKRSAIGQLEILSELRAVKDNKKQPTWYNEFGATACYSSIRGYWLYALDPLSLIGQDPTFALYYRIDMYNAKFYGNNEWPKPLGYIPSQEQFYEQEASKPKKVTKALSNSYNREGLGGLYTYHSNASLWYIPEQQDVSGKTRRTCYNPADYQSRISLTSVEARHPHVTFKHSYGLRSIFDNFLLVINK